MKVTRLMQVAAAMTVMLTAAEAWASSPGGDFLGQSLKRNAILASNCGLDANMIKKYEAVVPTKIAGLNATRIYIQDALKAFNTTKSEYFTDSEISPTSENCIWVQKKITSYIE